MGSAVERWSTSHTPEASGNTRSRKLLASALHECSTSCLRGHETVLYRVAMIVKSAKVLLVLWHERSNVLLSTRFG